MPITKITSPDDPALDELCEKLAGLARSLDLSSDWPSRQLELCGEYGVFEWFLEPEWGGQGWDNGAVTRGYLALSSACLTTTFVITQRTGACRRIASSAQRELQELLLPDLVNGGLMATVAVSHLTTSRRHLAQPVLSAQRAADGFVFNGFSPWVTGAAQSKYIVAGATVVVDDDDDDDDDDATPEQLLVALPTDLPGVTTGEPVQMVGLTASHTGQLHFDNVLIEDKWVLAGPVENVMSAGFGAGAGGAQTSTLALGLARSAIDFLAAESQQRTELGTPVESLEQDYQKVEGLLFSVVRGESDCTTEQLRKRANSLALRSSQAAMAAAKGTGYILGHPAGRWCREALFFLVWSCPQPVVTANLCEFAGIAQE